jgi:hypothetical protein
MANSQGIANSFKSEVMMGYHQLGAPTLTSRGSLTAPTNDAIKAALYLASATTNNANTAYTATGEVSGTNYVAGGVTVTNANAPSTSSGVGIWTPSASIVYTTVTLSTAFDAVMLYNSTQGNKAIGVYTFGSQTVTAGTLTLTMPANDSTHALIQLS